MKNLPKYYIPQGIYTNEIDTERYYSIEEARKNGRGDKILIVYPLIWETTMICGKEANRARYDYLNKFYIVK